MPELLSRGESPVVGLELDQLDPSPGKEDEPVRDPLLDRDDLGGDPSEAADRFSELRFDVRLSHEGLV